MPENAERCSPPRAMATTAEANTPTKAKAMTAVLSALRNGSTSRTSRAVAAMMISGRMVVRSGASI